MRFFKDFYSKIYSFISGSKGYSAYDYYNAPFVFDFNRVVTDSNLQYQEHPKSFSLLRDEEKTTLSSLRNYYGKPYFKSKEKGLTVYGFKMKSLGLKIKIQVGFKCKKVVCVHKMFFGKDADIKNVDDKLRYKYKILGDNNQIGYKHKKVFNFYTNSHFSKHYNQIELIQIFDLDSMKESLNHSVGKLKKQKKNRQKLKDNYFGQVA